MLVNFRNAALMLLAAQIVAWPAAAAACSCWATTIDQSEPADGASDVPLNQALVVQGHLNPQSLKLEDARGAQVEFELNQGPLPGCGVIWAELRPKGPLSAMTKYTIRVGPSASVTQNPTVQSLTFTTGVRVLPEQTLATPKVRVSVIEGVPAPSAIGACSEGPVRVCIGLDDDKYVEMIARRDNKEIARGFWEGNHRLEELPDCLEFRRRAVTGQRSEPLVICGAALGVHSYRAGDSRDSFVLCHDGMFGVAPPTMTSGLPDAADAAVDSSASDAAIDTSTSAAAVDSSTSATTVDSSTSAATVDTATTDVAPGTAKNHAADDTGSSLASDDGCSLQPSEPSGRGPSWAAPLMLLFAMRMRRSRTRHPR